MSLLRGCISLQTGAIRPVAYCNFVPLGPAGWLRIEKARCAGQSVYASIMLFPRPLASKAASGFLLFTRFLPRLFFGLANTTATLGCFYWLGFETTGLSPDKKRIA
jgi:hypothetical protein